jgi:beta-apo-4'-carotenal oxygenase
VTLELGGRNPAIITKNADMRLAARRLLWGKHMNSGQICISHNYTLIEASMLQTFIAEFKIAFDEFFPHGAKASPDYARLINTKQFQRIKAMLDNSEGKVLYGGAMDEATLFMEPTLVQVSSPTDSLLTDESFGPLLPVPDLSTAIRLANEISGTPLGVYAFGSKPETARILNETRSGGATVNDSFFHGSIPTLAFGGVGESGQGSYRGKASFECFTHRRSVVTTPGWMERLLDVRYPPYTDSKLKMTKAMMDVAPNFDRDGIVRQGLVGYILGLGGKSVNEKVGRWAVAAFGELRFENLARELLILLIVTLLLRRYTRLVDVPFAKANATVSYVRRDVLTRVADIIAATAGIVRRRA